MGFSLPNKVLLSVLLSLLIIGAYVSATTDKTTYDLGESVKITVSESPATVIIKTPTTQYRFDEIQSSFFFRPEETGQYTIEITAESAREVNTFKVVNEAITQAPAETEEDDIEPRIIRIGERVQQTLTINSQETTTITIPYDSQDITLTNNGNPVQFTTKPEPLPSFLASSLFGAKAREQTLTITNPEEAEIKLTYTTAPPTKEEKSNSIKEKEIIVSSPEGLHYENVLVTTELPELTSRKEDVKAYWVEEDLYLSVETFDTDNNGLLDSAQLIAPHLSTQTFIIIVATAAEHLDEDREFVENVYEEIKERDDNWTNPIPQEHFIRVTFEQPLTEVNDITVYARPTQGSASIQVYEVGSTELLASFPPITAEGEYKIFLTNLENPQTTFDLKIINNPLEFDHIIDPTNFYYTGWEAGEDGWIDGGADSDRSTAQARWTDAGTLGGSWSWHLQDNSATSYVERAFDLSQYTFVDLEFSAYYNSLEGGECLDLYCDSTILWSYCANEEGTEDQWLDGCADDQCITIYRANCTFDSDTTIRFEAEFSGNGDNVYLDGINLTGTDTLPPEVTINTPEQLGTYAPPITFNVSLNENGTVWYSLDGGINNISMTFDGNSFVATNTSIADGDYIFSAYANDTEGYQNFTELSNFTIDAGYIPPTPLQFHYTGWEADEAGWIDGGADSDRSNVDSRWTDAGTLGGSWSWHLQDDTTESNIEQSFDFSRFDEVLIQFSAYYNSIEGAEALTLLCDGTVLWSYEANTLGTEDQWLDGCTDGQCVRVYPTNCTFDSDTTIRFEAEFSGNGDNVYLDGINLSGTDTTNPLVTIINPQGTYTSLPIQFNVTVNENSVVQYSINYDTNISMAGNGTEFGALNTSIADGIHTAHFYVTDESGNQNFTESSQFTVDINYIPTHTTPTINSSRGGNLTTENITVYNQSTSDIEGEPVKNVINWHVDNTPFEVLNYPFDGATNTSFTQDFSENSVNLTTVGAVLNQSNGFDGFNSFEFNGVDAYLSSGSVDLSTWLGNTASLSVWIKTTQTGSDTMWLAPGIAGVEESGGSDDIFWGWIDASGNIAIQAANTAGAESTSPINDNQWHHIVMTRDASNGVVELYIDGSLNDTATSASGVTGNSFFRFGSIEDTGGSPTYFQGSLDDIRVYDRIITSEQVALLYQNTPQTIAASETSVGEAWVGCITPVDKVLAGNQLCSANLTVSIDLPPTANLTTPANGTITSDTSQNLTVDIDDTVGLANATLFIYNESDDLINETTVTVTGTEALIGIIYNFLTDGIYTWFYRVVDVANNIVFSQNASLTIDTISPLVTINSPTSVVYNANDIPLTFSVTLNEEGSTVFYTLDNGANNVSMSTSDNLDYTASNGSLTDGTYTFRVFATDVAGNTNYSESVIFSLDTDVPWWNPTYQYRRQLNVTVGANEPYNNYSGYTVQITTDTNTLVSIGKMQADMDDLRIVYYNGSNNIELDRIVIDENSAESLLRFKLLANISAGSSDLNYYMYYGSTDATNPPMNASAVYLWYDNATDDRESQYTQGRVDATVHGGSWGDSITHNAAGYYDFDTGDNFGDGFRPTNIIERDVYIEYEEWETAAYDTEMTSGPITRWEGTGSGGTENSNHLYYYAIADSDVDTSPAYDWNDDILADDRASGAVVVANGGAISLPTASWTRMGIASWGVNPTNLAAWYDESPVSNESGGWDTERFSGTHAAGSDNENPGQAGLWLQQDAGRFRNILIRRYISPEPTVNEGSEELSNIPPFAPELEFPINNSAFSTFTEFNWTNTTDPEGDAIFYILEVSNITNFSTFSYRNPSIIETETPTGATPTGITLEGTYYWRVRAYDLSGNSSYSETRTVYYDTSSPLVNLTHPANNTANTTSNTVSFTFNVTDISTINSCSIIFNGAVNQTNTTVTKAIATTFTSTLPNGIYYWNVNCTDQVGFTSSSEIRTINMSVLNNPPAAHEIECEQNGASWTDCSNIAFYNNITRLRLRCTDPENSVVNATFNLTNIPDKTTSVYDTTSVNVGDYWILDNNDVFVRDSGDWSIATTCTDNETLTDSNQSSWIVPWGNLTVDLVEPSENSNVLQYDLFNFTVNVNCLYGECNGVNVTLDPITWWNSSYVFRKQLNVTVGANEPYNNYSGYTVQITTDTNTLVSTGKMQADMDDLRIVYYNGSNNIELDRIVIDNNSLQTIVRFKLVNNITSSDDGYYLYYGADSATNPPANASEVYLWYDSATDDRESQYTQGRLDSSAHGPAWANSISHSSTEYSFDTGDNFADSFRPASITERDVYIEYEEEQIGAYPTDMTSGPITRWEGTGTGSSEDSDHFYFYAIADSGFFGGSYSNHDDILDDGRTGTPIITSGTLGAFPQTSWTRVGLASWGVNPTNLATWYDESPASNESGGWDTERFSGTHDGSLDNENPGQAGIWLQQDEGNLRNILIRRYTSPEPSVVELAEEQQEKGVISTTLGETPFYTINENPMSYSETSCLADLRAGDQCEVTWSVNATGDVGLTFTFFAIPNATNQSLVVGGTISDTVDLTIVSQFPPTTPILNSPVNATGSDSWIEFNWLNSTDPNGDTITYRLEVSNISDFSTLQYSNGSIAETASPTGDTPTGISAQGIYYWRVLASDGLDNSSYSEVRTFYYDTEAPTLTLLNQTGEDGAIINETHPLDDGENLTITVEATDVEVEAVWIIIWETISGGVELFRFLFTFIGNNLWQAVIPGNISLNGTDYNYTIYVNDTVGEETTIEGNFSILKGSTTIAINPQIISSVGNTTLSGVMELTNGSALSNHPFNIYINGDILLLSNVTPIGAYSTTQVVNDTTDNEFNKGLFTNTSSDGNSITLDTGRASGSFSRIIDAGARVEWGGASWSSIGSSCSATVTIQQGSNGYTFAEDTYIDSGNPATNYGAETALFIDSSPTTQKGIIAFKGVIGRAFNQVPPNATINEANITLSVTDTGDIVEIYQVLENWTDSETTYNERLTGTPWGSVGINGLPSRLLTAEDSFTASAIGNYTVDITTAMRGWVNGSRQNYGIVIDPTASNGITIASSETSLTTIRPKLAIGYNATDCTEITLYVRTSNDGSSWTDWQTVGNNQQIDDSNEASRYLEYRFELTAINTTLTPTLSEALFNYTAIVTNDSGGFEYNISTPSQFGSYGVSVNTSLRTIEISNQTTLSVQTGVPPTVELVAPPNASWYSTNTINFTFNASDINDDIISADLLINGLANATNQSLVNNGGLTNISATLTSGEYLWSVNVTDSSGFAINSSQRTIFVDLIEPAVTLVFPQNNSGYILNEINLSFSATDNMDTALACAVTQDGTEIYSGINALNGTIVNRSSGVLAAGLHYWNVTCIDEAGNSATSQTFTFNLTDTPPTISLTTPDNGTIFTDNEVSFVYQADDNTGFTNASLILNGVLDSSNITIITNHANNTIERTGLTEGIYLWTILAFDLSGNYDIPDNRTVIIDLSAPTITLNQPANETILNYSDVSFNFTAFDTIDQSMVCNLRVGDRLDSGFTALNGSLTNRVLLDFTDGSRVWNITCTDDAGYQNTSDSYTLTIAEPPTVTLETPNLTAFSTDTFNVSYIPTDNTNISSCNVYLNGVQNASNTSIIINGAQNNITLTSIPTGDYNWFVNCTDYASLSSVSETRLFSVDFQGPNITLHYPQGDEINTQNISFNFTAVDSSDASFSCDISVDSTVVDSGFTAFNDTTIQRNISGIPDGFHTWFVNCTDGADNTGNSPIYNFTKSTPPVVSLIAPVDNNWVNTTPFNLTYLPEDDEGFLITSLYINTLLNETNSTEVVPGANNSFVITSLPDGFYNWTVTVTDIRGLNTTANPVRTFNLDTIAPSITLSEPTNNTYATNNITFNFSASDNLDNLLNCELILDGEVEYTDNSTNGAEVINYLLVADGSHSWNIVCIDEAGNINVSETIFFSVEAPPNVTLVSPSNGAYFNNVSTLFTYIPEDPIGITSCTLYINGISNETDATITTNQINNFTVDNINEGNQNWTVECIDAAPDLNPFRAVEYNFTIDRTAPVVTLNAPSNSSTTLRDVSFNFTSIDALDETLTCAIYIDGIANITAIQTPNGTQIVSPVDSIPVGNHNWNVTCADNATNSGWSSLWNFEAVLADISINASGIVLNTTSLTENETVTINVTINNLVNTTISNITVQIFDGDPQASGTQIGNNQTITTLGALQTTTLMFLWNADLGTSAIFGVADPPIATNGSIEESNETNNQANVSVAVGAWHYVVGDLSALSQYQLAGSTNTSVLRWSANNFEGGNIYVTDAESSIAWSALQAIGKDISNGDTSNDIAEIDSILEMTGFADSFSNLYLNESGGFINRIPITIFKNTLNNIPVTNSTNNTDFVTGVLWDTSDDTNTEFDIGDREDIILITEIKRDTAGAYGTYDYEIRIAAKLREYIDASSRSVAIYTELR